MNKKITVFEIVWYSITSAVALWGLVYIVLGLIGNYADVPHHKNYLAQAGAQHAATFGLDFFGWGIIIFAIGVLAAVIVLIIFSTKIDKKNDKAARRAARLEKIKSEMASEAK